MKQLSRALSLGFACSLALGALAGQSAFGSVADLGAASSSSVSTSDVSSSTGSTEVSAVQTSFTTDNRGGQGGGWSPPPPIWPVPEANAGFILAALIPLMLLLTPARLRKLLGAFRSSRAVASTV
jgi:hypothetical protein